MGLNSRGGGSSNKTYLSVYQGKLVLEYSKEEDLVKKLEYLGLDPNDIKVRQKTKGRYEGQDVFYYVLYDVSGKLTGISLRENDYGEFMELEFTDVDEKFMVSLGDVYSRISKDFIRRVGGLDLSEELVFGVWSISAEDSENGKPKSGTLMYQNDEKVDYFIPFEDLPEPVTKTRGRKTTWDFTEQENFLYESLTNFIADYFSSPEVTEKLPEKNDNPPKRAPRKPVTATKDDDMPF